MGFVLCVFAPLREALAFADARASDTSPTIGVLFLLCAFCAFLRLILCRPLKRALPITMALIPGFRCAPPGANSAVCFADWFNRYVINVSRLASEFCFAQPVVTNMPTTPRSRRIVTSLIFLCSVDPPSPVQRTADKCPRPNLTQADYSSLPTGFPRSVRGPEAGLTAPSSQ